MQRTSSLNNLYLRGTCMWLIAIVLALGCGLLISIGGIKVAALLAILPLLLAGGIGLFKYPRLGLLLTVIYGFFIAGLSRYIGGIPWGLGTDGLLIITLVALFIQTGTQFPVNRLK